MSAIASLLLLACGGGFTCGPGTYASDGACLPEAISDSAPPDAPLDTGAPEDTEPGETGETDETASPDTGAGDTGADPEPRPAQVYLLAGQSNMVGIGQVTGLPATLRVAQDDVQIWWSGAPYWRGLQPSSDYSSGWAAYTGPEVSFGRALADAQPDADIYLIKHAVGGTALADFWDPGDTPASPQGEGYRVFRQTVDAALAALDDAGIAYEIAGMIWMQGESDAAYEPYAYAYEENLTRFIERAREDAGAPEMPFALGLIHCEGVCYWREPVRSAQSAVADADPAVHAIETEDLDLYPLDWWHYQGTGIRVMGERFADALLGEAHSAWPTPAVRLVGSYSYSYYGDFTVGWSFEVDRAIEVTDVGVFDLGDDGLARDTTVGIWEASTGSLLATTELNAAAGGDTPWIEGFRFAGCDPLVLEPGAYVIGNVTYSSNFDHYVYNAAYEASDAVGWIEGRHADGANLYFPTTATAGTATVGLWFGPNLLYREL